MSHPDYVIFNRKSAQKFGMLSLYNIWAKEFCLDLDRPVKCMGSAPNLRGEPCYKILGPDGNFSVVGEGVFDPCMPRPINLDDYL